MHHLTGDGIDAHAIRHSDGRVHNTGFGIFRTVGELDTKACISQSTSDSSSLCDLQILVAQLVFRVEIPLDNRIGDIALLGISAVEIDSRFHDGKLIVHFTDKLADGSLGVLQTEPQLTVCYLKVHPLARLSVFIHFSQLSHEFGRIKTIYTVQFAYGCHFIDNCFIHFCSLLNL